MYFSNNEFDFICNKYEWFTENIRLIHIPVLNLYYYVEDVPGRKETSDLFCYHGF